MKVLFVAAAFVNVGHGLSFAVPPGWTVTHRAFTPCTEPLERVSLVHGDQILMLQERLDPVPAELRARRPAHFAVHGGPHAIECCSIGSRRGWVIEFAQGGRAFYAFLYPGRGPAAPLLHVLDSLRTGGDPG